MGGGQILPCFSPLNYFARMGPSVAAQGEEVPGKPLDCRMTNGAERVPAWTADVGGLTPVALYRCNNSVGFQLVFGSW